MAAPFINGVQHSWSSINLNLLGRTVTGFSAISYEDKQEKVNHHGAGSYPTHRGVGKYEANANITLYSYEVDAIQASLEQGQRLQDIAPFDIVVVYKEKGSAKLVTHTIRNCEFTMNKRDVKQGDTTIEVEHELIVSHIEWN